MKHVKVIFLSFLFLSVLVLLFSLLIPSSTKVSRAVTIQKNMDSVVNAIYNIQQWNQWNTAVQSAATGNQPIEIDTISNTITVNKVKMSVKKASDSLLRITMVNQKGETVLSDVSFFQHPNQCSVNWVYHFKSKWYPWEKFRSIFYDNMFGPVLDSNLTALKNYLEK